jgi:hypothetical protein
MISDSLTGSVPGTNGTPIDVTKALLLIIGTHLKSDLQLNHDNIVQSTRCTCACRADIASERA